MHATTLPHVCTSNFIPSMYFKTVTLTLTLYSTMLWVDMRDFQNCKYKLKHKFQAKYLHLQAMQKINYIATKIILRQGLECPNPDPPPKNHKYMQVHELSGLKCSTIGIGFNGAETNCGIAHILGILLMNSYDFRYFNMQQLLT